MIYFSVSLSHRRSTQFLSKLNPLSLDSRSVCSGRINYSRMELLRLKSKYRLSPGVYSTLKCLRILRIRRSLGGRRVTPNLKYISTMISCCNDSQHHRIHRFANHNNLLSLPPQIPQGKLSQFVCSIINARSIRNKTLLIQDFVVDNLVDILIMTETWLNRCGVKRKTIVSRALNWQTRCRNLH